MRFGAATRGALCALFVTGFVGLASAQDRPGAAPARAGGGAERDIDLVYAIYFGGLDMLDVDIGLKLGRGRYEVDVSTRLKGFFGRMFPWSMQANSTGRMDEARIIPVAAHTENTWRGTRRWMTIRYEDGRPVVVSAKPEPTPNAVPPEELRDVLDAASALFAVARAAKTAEACAGKLPVYDGRRRFDAVVKALGEDVLRKTRYSAFAGTAVACDLSLDLRHGRNRETDYGGLANGEKTMTLWFATLFDGAPPVPVRVEYTAQMGVVIGHLARATMSGASRVYARKR